LRRPIPGPRLPRAPLPARWWSGLWRMRTGPPSSPSSTPVDTTLRSGRVGTLGMHTEGSLPESGGGGAVQFSGLVSPLYVLFPPRPAVNLLEPLGCTPKDRGPRPHGIFFGISPPLRGVWWDHPVHHVRADREPPGEPRAPHGHPVGIQAPPPEGWGPSQQQGGGTPEYPDGVLQY